MENVENMWEKPMGTWENTWEDDGKTWGKSPNQPCIVSPKCPLFSWENRRENYEIKHQLGAHFREHREVSTVMSWDIAHIIGQSSKSSPRNLMSSDFLQAFTEEQFIFQDPCVHVCPKPVDKLTFSIRFAMNNAVLKNPQFPETIL